jgi:hypothetical protein
MKALAILHMIFGALASLIAWSLADLKAFGYSPARDDRLQCPQFYF